MGALCGSKPKNDEEKYVFDTRRIFIDKFGNVRYRGPDAELIDREKEMQAIIKAESQAQVKKNTKK